MKATAFPPQLMPKAEAEAVTGSLNPMVTAASTVTVEPAPGVAWATVGASSGGGGVQSDVWEPRPSNVSTAKPSHSAAGSKAFAPLVSPMQTEALRRSVLSAVLVRPVPHSDPGSKPIWPNASTIVPLAPPLRSAMASSPFQLMVAELVTSATAMMASFAWPCAATKTSPVLRVPDRVIALETVAEPLL